MYALRMSVVEISREIPAQFLLETSIEGIDSRVCIVPTEDAHAGAKRDPAARGDGYDIGPRWRLRGGAKTGRSERGRADYAELLRAVVGDGSHLRQHVLSSVKDAIAGPQHGFSLLGNVPGEAKPRLKFFFGAVQRAV